MRVIIIHRWGGNPESDWYPWLQKELEQRGIEVLVPRMPNTSKPDIKAWVSHLQKIVGQLNSETHFVAHSIGCQTVMRFLESTTAETKAGTKMGKIIFVAGWFKLGNLESKAIEAIAKPWVKTPLDFRNIRSKMRSLTVFLSRDEPYGFVEENAALFREKLGANVIIENNQGHYTAEEGIITVLEVLRRLVAPVTPQR